LLEKLELEEIEFLEDLHNPICLIESLFSNLDNLVVFDEEEFSHIRLAQFTLLSYEYFIDKDPKLSEKENFKLKEGSGTVICFGGRKFGKTLFIEILDLFCSMIINDGENCGFSSYDAMHIRGILEKVIQVLENHPFFLMYEAKINRSPTYRMFLKNGYSCESVNMNLQGENAGCFDDKTEIFTESGFKFFKDLKEEKVLTLDLTTNTTSFVDVKNKIEYEYNGILKELNSRTSKFLVTPNHNLLLEIDKKSKILKVISDTDLPEELHILINFKPPFDTLVFKKSLIKDVNYSGKVYCVEVEPHHTIYVRRNGCVMWSGNSQFYQKHFSRLYLEEASFETQEVYEKRLDSVSENGCVFRIAGMTTFTKYSPAGKMFYDLNNKSRLVNLSQYCNPKWDEKEKARAIKEHGGEDSLPYKIFVKGEVAEDGISALDMERVRKCYNDKKQIKHIEITKENFHDYEYRLIVEKPVNCDNLYLSADIGEAVSELIIISETNLQYKYLYNITLYNLTDKEQFKIFRFLGEKLSASFIGLDTTDGMARAIYRSLEEVFPKENLTWCFTPDTDILTNSGWKKFYELSKDDKVLTLDSIKNESFYTDIVNFYEKDFDGELVSYQGKRLKFRVTPEHSLWLRPHTMTNKFKFIKAKELKGNESVKRDIGIFSGLDLNEIKIEGIRFGKKKIISFNSIYFLKFLGWYLSEGYVHRNNTISIYQSEKVNKTKYYEIIEVIKKLGLNFYAGNDRITINNKLLCDWLKKECYISKNCKIKIKTIYNCYNKKIPELIRNLSPTLIKIFVDEIWKGDGFKTVSSKQEGYNTSSIKLADDVQELLLKIGIVSTVAKTTEKENNIYSKSFNKSIKHREEGYTVLKCRNKNSTIKTNNLKKEFYKGKVYDVEVKPYHLIYVRIAGKSFWSGNCSFNEKIKVSIDKDENGNEIFKDGKPVWKEEFVDGWSIKRLRDLFYEEGKMELPLDYKLDVQLNSIIATQSGNRTLYTCVASQDHLLAAFRVFAISEWLNYLTIIKPIRKKTFSKVGV
jgi:hypothetical protein